MINIHKALLIFINEKTELNFKNSEENDKIIIKIQTALIESIFKDFQKKNNFQLFHKNEYYYLTAKLDCSDSDGINLKKVKVYSFEDVQEKFIDSPKEKDIFLKNIGKFRKIIGEEIIATAPKLEMESCLKPIHLPNYLMVKNINFYFSKEFKNALLGLRNEDHRVSLDLLHKTLEKKVRSLKKMKIVGMKSLSYYFKIKSEEKLKILNVIIGVNQLGSNRKSFVIITAYFPSCSVVKHCLGFSGEMYKNWFENLTAIEE